MRYVYCCSCLTLGIVAFKPILSNLCTSDYYICISESCRDASGGLETSPELAKRLITETDGGGRGGRQRQQQWHQVVVRKSLGEDVLMCVCFHHPTECLCGFLISISCC